MSEASDAAFDRCSSSLANLRRTCLGCSMSGDGGYDICAACNGGAKQACACTAARCCDVSVTAAVYVDTSNALSVQSAN